MSFRKSFKGLPRFLILKISSHVTLKSRIREPSVTLYLLVLHNTLSLFPDSDEMLSGSGTSRYVFPVKMSRCSCSWPNIAITVSLCVALFPSTVALLVQSTSPSTNFSFPVFESINDFITYGEVRYNPDTLSFTTRPSGFNPTRLSCVKLFYRQKVRTKEWESGALVSFSTSFTFSITEQEHSTNRSGWLAFPIVGMVFSFTSENIDSTLFAGKPDPVILKSIKYFAVEFDNYNNYLNEDPSDNHIGVNINNVKSAHTYNLCGGNRTSCSFPWTAHTYTAWIDYNGSSRSLEVWFANGSLREGVTKPAGSGLIKVSELDLTDLFGDYMYIGFSGTSGSLTDTHEVLSWNFANSFSEEVPALTPIQTQHLFKRIITICAAFGVVIVLFKCCYWRRQTHKVKSEPGLGLNLLIGLRRFSFKELKKATNNFNESALLGKGGSGSVYRGTLTPSGVVIAVKRLNHDSEHVQREFLAEVSSISQIRHRNLVHLQGWCHEDRHFLLVFEYMSNGSLDEWLFPSRRRRPLDPKYKKFEVLPLELRFSILAGVAAAVEYLHEEWVQCVLHRDIKSSNVMIDADFNPHLGDFGLARLIDHEKLAKTTMMAGTFGYMAPEMHYTGKATKESDVYGFGILLLEVVCGRRAVNLQVEDPDEDFLLLQSVWRAHESGNILSAVDARFLNLQLQQLEPLNELNPNTTPVAIAGVNSGNERKIVSLLHLGLRCCLSDPESRPSMRVVKQVILEVQFSTSEDTITILNSMSPLLSTMPLHVDLKPGSNPWEPNTSMIATNLKEMEAPFLPKRNIASGGVRHRFLTC